MTDCRRAPAGAAPLIAPFAALLATLLCVAAAAPAWEIETASIDFEGRSYRYDIAIVVAAPAAAVRHLVTDYEHLAYINSEVVESVILEHLGPGRLKRRMVIKHCLRPICIDMIHVETVEEQPDGSIVSTIIPRESNFEDGVATWRIDAVDADTTRVSVSALQTPSFWIPPFIGPRLIRRSFVAQVRNTARNIEQIAAPARPFQPAQ
ncbi:MAG: SRPBCC family protein [Gammaproteobacteria bacterium]|nr:SRPBCC family protein [Gammaproteobacteria bacterium]